MKWQSNKLHTIYNSIYYFVGALIDDVIEENVYIQESDEATTKVNEYTTGRDMYVVIRLRKIHRKIDRINTIGDGW